MLQESNPESQKLHHSRYLSRTRTVAKGEEQMLHAPPQMAEAVSVHLDVLAPVTGFIKQRSEWKRSNAGWEELNNVCLMAILLSWEIHSQVYKGYLAGIQDETTTLELVDAFGH